ncbi:hypothetical protein MA9V2_236 [Chryseobacterium phage MA9V-2]|nr:hypothetical protein MA9V2_236 [Chryseobacterium phage MA9V-2]
MAKFTKLAGEVAKLYDGKVTGSIIKFDSEDDLFKAADEIADQFAFTMDQDKLTIEFLNENIDIKFLKQFASAMGVSQFTNESVDKLTKQIGISLNEAEVDTVTTLLNKVESPEYPDVAKVAADPMQQIADTITNSAATGATLDIVDGENSAKQIVIRTDDKLIAATPTDIVAINESAYVHYGMHQLNENEYNALKALEDVNARRRFLTSMGIMDLDADSISKNLELLKPLHPDMDANGLLPLNEANVTIINVSNAFANEASNALANVANLYAKFVNENNSWTVKSYDAADVKATLVSAGIPANEIFMNESKDMDIYNLQSKVALFCKKSGLSGADVQKALLLVNLEAKEAKPNFSKYVNIKDSMLNESADAQDAEEMFERKNKAYAKMISKDGLAAELTEFLASFGENAKVPEDGLVGEYGELSADLQEGINKFMEERGYFANESTNWTLDKKSKGEYNEWHITGDALNKVKSRDEIFDVLPELKGIYKTLIDSKNGLKYSDRVKVGSITVTGDDMGDILNFLKGNGSLNESVDANEEIESVYKFESIKDIEVAAAAKGYVCKGHSGQSESSDKYKFDILAKGGKKCAMGIYDKTKKIAILDVNDEHKGTALLEAKMINESFTNESAGIENLFASMGATFNKELRTDGTYKYQVTGLVGYANEATEVPNTADLIAFEILKLYGNFKEATRLSRSVVKQALRNVIDTLKVDDSWLTDESKFISLFEAIDTMRVDFGPIDESSNLPTKTSELKINAYVAFKNNGARIFGKISGIKGDEVSVKLTNGKQMLVDAKDVILGLENYVNESIPQQEAKIAGTKAKIAEIKSEAKAASANASSKISTEKAKLVNARATLKNLKKSKSLNESKAPQGVGGNVYVVPNSSFQNPWLTHKLETSLGMRGYQFANQFKSDIVNADIMVDYYVAKDDKVSEVCMDMEGTSKPQKTEIIATPVSIYINENNVLCFNENPIPTEIAENGQIGSVAQFKEYAKYILSGGIPGADSACEEGPVTQEDIAKIDSICDACGENYGAMMGKFDDYLSQKATVN